jgi:hypothetical protein
VETGERGQKLDVAGRFFARSLEQRLGFARIARDLLVHARELDGALALGLGGNGSVE